MTAGGGPFALGFLALLGSTTPIAAQTATANFKVNVATADEFITALERQVAHIVITEHLDLAELTVSTSILDETGDEGSNRTAFSNPSRQLLTAATQSIQVCACPLPHTAHSHVRRWCLGGGGGGTVSGGPAAGASSTCLAVGTRDTAAVPAHGLPPAAATRPRTPSLACATPAEGGPSVEVQSSDSGDCLQGNCSTPVEDFLSGPQFPAIVSSRNGQCALLIRGNLLEARVSSLWLHNLYLRSTALALPVNADYGAPFGMLAVSHGALYLSSITFQGEITPVNSTRPRDEINLLARNTMPVSMGSTEEADLRDIRAQVLMIGARPCSAFVRLDQVCAPLHPEQCMHSPGARERAHVARQVTRAAVQTASCRRSTTSRRSSGAPSRSSAPPLRT